MLKVTIYIDNKTAHGCSPLKFLEKFILCNAQEIVQETGSFVIYDTPHAVITVKKIEQI